jgi:uncharacterized protein
MTIMELAQLIEALSKATAYPHAVETVEVRQTHISVVFLAGPYVYKVKKSVNLGFLDFTTLDLRRHFCDEEVRLNRRLAPNVYLGVVPVARTSAGLEVEGQGETIEWAVKMARLPEEATLQKRLERGEVTGELLTTLAQKIAWFHAHAESGPRIVAFGRFEVVASNARENFDQTAPQVGFTVSRQVFDRVKTLSDQELVRLRPLIEDRANRGVPRDTHGDLHLDHVYLFPEREPPGDLVIIDCIEFNERFRFADPVADMAFLAMDLRFHGRRDLAGVFVESYFTASGDRDGLALLPFYTAYRAAVRGKVEGFELLEKEVPQAEREGALMRARAHWLLALGQLEQPGRKPCLVLAGGLPGTGKSTLARHLADRAGFTVVRSDVVRKELAGVPPHSSARSTFGEGLYSTEWTDRTYAECLTRAKVLLFGGARVIVDATFAEESKRLLFLEAANRLGVPAALLLCHADPQVVESRLDHRQGDASDADLAVYHQATAIWEPLSTPSRPAAHLISTDGSPEEAVVQAIESLGEFGLFG